MPPRHRAQHCNVLRAFVAGVATQGLLQWLCCSSLWLLPQADATVTLLSSGLRYPSRPELAFGKQLWRGYEYMARLQFVPGHLDLCPPASANHSQNDYYYNVTPPVDGLPLALLVRTSNPSNPNRDCRLQDQIRTALTHLQPPGIVKYLLVEDAASSNGFEGMKVDEEGDRSVFDVDALPTVLDPDDPTDVPLYVNYISTRTLLELLDTVLHLDAETLANGGPRISIDGRTGTGGFLDGPEAVWIAVAALLGACACSCLLLAGGNNNGGFWWNPRDDDPHPPPPRPTRRRLTRTQVQRLLPTWRYDGSELRPTHPYHPPTAQAEGDRDGLEAPLLPPASVTPTPLTPPVPVELSLCSICLDDYEAGDRLRCLPCHHAFHSKCIGKWLVERSATCPLCKTDLFDDDEEEEEEDEEQGQQPLVVPQPPPPPGNGTYGANPWDRAWHNFFSSRWQHQNDVRRQHDELRQQLQQLQQLQQQPQPPPLLSFVPPNHESSEADGLNGGAAVVVSDREAFHRTNRQSWLDRLRSVRFAAHMDAGTPTPSAPLTEPLLPLSSRPSSSSSHASSPRRGASSSSPHGPHESELRVLSSHGTTTPTGALATPASSLSDAGTTTTAAAAPHCAPLPTVEPDRDPISVDPLSSATPPRQVSV